MTIRCASANIAGMTTMNVESATTVAVERSSLTIGRKMATEQEQFEIDSLTPEGLAYYEELTIDGKLLHSVAFKLAKGRYGTRQVPIT